MNQQIDQPNPVERKIDLNNTANEPKVREPEAGYEMIYGHESGGIVWRHELVDVKGVDYADVLEIAIDKANIGCEVHMLPILSKDHPLRKTVFANAKERKCPDLKIDGRYTEVKVPIDTLHDQKLSKNIKIAHTQANEVVIKLHSFFDPHILGRIAKGRFLMHKNLDSIEFKVDNSYHCFRRSDLV